MTYIVFCFDVSSCCDHQTYGLRASFITSPVQRGLAILMIIIGGKQRNTANKSNNKHATQTIHREHASEAKTRQERWQQEGMGLGKDLGEG